LLYFKGLNIQDNGAQKLCAEAWNALNSDTRKNYEEEAKNTPNLPVKDSFITNANSRKTQISNGIRDIRKMVINIALINNNLGFNNNKVSIYSIKLYKLLVVWSSLLWLCLILMSLEVIGLDQILGKNFIKLIAI
jgi:hypothetical protein